MAANEGVDVDLAARIEQLTAKQRACLDLVDDHATSKEIARELGISRHTVDARLRAAIQILGVSSRREAAVIYRAAADAESYQSFTYQPPQVADSRSNPQVSAHGVDSEQFEQMETRAQDPDGSMHWSPPAYPQPGRQQVAFAPDHVADSAAWTFGAIADSRESHPRFRLWGGSNDLTPAQRVAGVFIVTILAMLAFGTFLSGIEALTLLHS